MRERQYHQQPFMGRASNRSSQQSQLQSSSQHFSRTLYAGRGADPYFAAAGASSHYYGSQYPPRIGPSRDLYLPSDTADVRARPLGAERRLAAAPSYPSQSYVDYVDPRILPANPISSRGLPYPAQYSLGGHHSSAALANQSELLVRGRRADITSTPYSRARGHQAYGTSDLAQRSRVNPAGILDSPMIIADSVVVPGARRSGGRRLTPGYGGREFLPGISNNEHLGLHGSGARDGVYLSPYAADETALKRSRYSMIGNNVNADMYSNYRQAKARRTDISEDFVRTVPTARRGRARDRRDRRRRENTLFRRDRVKESPLSSTRKGKEKGSVPKDEDANCPDHSRHSSDTPGDADQSHEKGEHTSSPKGENIRAFDDSKPGSDQLPSGDVGQEDDDNGDDDREIHDKIRQEKDDKTQEETDKDSELGSLCADGSDSEDKKVKQKKKLEKPATVVDGPLDGMIFGCSSATFHECMKLRLFGLPAKNKELVMRVAPGTKLFLFNFDTKELSGIFEAISKGGMQIQPDAFQKYGGFPAQVQVCCSAQCPNLPISTVKPVIQDNYINHHKFRFDLNASQVKELINLFKRAAREQPRQQGNMLSNHASSHLESQDYLMRGSQRQRQMYLQHPSQARFGLSSLSSARVIPMSPKTNLHVSKRPSRRARRERKKRKVDSGFQPLKADNCSLYSLSGEIGEADTGRNDSTCRDGTDTSNKTHDVRVREVIEKGNSRNVHQHKQIVETLVGNSDTQGRDAPGPDDVNSSKPGKFPESQSDLENMDGKQVSFIEDGSNDGKFGLAGGRIEEQGEGENGLKGNLDISGDVIPRSLDSTPFPAAIEGHCLDVQGVLTTPDARAFVKLALPSESGVSIANKCQIAEVPGCEIVIPDGDVETKYGTVRCASIGGHPVECLVNVMKYPVVHVENGVDNSFSEYLEDAPRIDRTAMEDAQNSLVDASGYCFPLKGRGKALGIEQKLCTNSAHKSSKQMESLLSEIDGDLEMSELDEKGKEQSLGDHFIVPKECNNKDNLGICELNTMDIATVSKLSNISEHEVVVCNTECGADCELPNVGKGAAVVRVPDEAVVYEPPAGVEEDGAEDAVDYECSTAGEEEELVVTANHVHELRAGSEEDVVIAEDGVDHESSTGGEEEEVGLTANGAVGCELHGPDGEEDLVIMAEDAVDYESSTAGQEEEQAVFAVGVSTCEVPAIVEDDDALIAEDTVDYESSSAGEQEEVVEYSDDGEDDDVREESDEVVVDAQDCELPDVCEDEEGSSDGSSYESD